MDPRLVGLTQRRSGVRAPLRPLRNPHPWGLLIIITPRYFQVIEQTENFALLSSEVVIKVVLGADFPADNEYMRWYRPGVQFYIVS